MDTVSNTLLLILILLVGILGAIKSANFIRRLTEEAFSSNSETTPASKTTSIDLRLSPFSQSMNVDLISSKL